ncbi:hypothetical protein [Pedobacter sp.]|uniref:hypothetical protein n=1 Tax=Pedobacter sp. TaxID=1411316 RepID=UPI003BA966B9
MKKELQSKLLGFILPNFIILFIIGINRNLHIDNEGVLVFSEFIILPILMGIISSWFWRNLNLTSGQRVGYSMLNGALAILLSFVFLGEGMICLIIVSPLIFAFVITGVFIGKVMFKKQNTKLNVSLISMLLLIFITDAVSEHDHENMVGDKILINAPVDKIWKHVVAFDKIKQGNQYWLFKIGMPSPMQTTVTGYHLGAGRKCIFSNGYVFDEKIVAFDVNHNLTFDIVNQPLDPEIMGHIDIKRGQFILKDNGNGTTTLIGNSWYKLHVFPVWYYDIWAENITRNVHLRVMKHIKILSEQ